MGESLNKQLGTGVMPCRNTLNRSNNSEVPPAERVYFLLVCFLWQAEEMTTTSFAGSVKVIYHLLMEEVDL
jgi:hypothetical protein